MDRKRTFTLVVIANYDDCTWGGLQFLCSQKQLDVARLRGPLLVIASLIFRKCENVCRGVDFWKPFKRSTDGKRDILMTSI
jgi:hypothetical protein